MTLVPASPPLLWLALPAPFWRLVLLKELLYQLSDSSTPLFQTMVSVGDGVIQGETTLRIGASRDLDVRVEELSNGLTRSIPEPTTKGGRLAQHILLAHDDVGYRNGLSAFKINGEALVQAVSELNFS